MLVAVEGCAHGELEQIYACVEDANETYRNDGVEDQIELLICCGDFQATRNGDDLCCMAVPPKHRHICTFYKYYSGEKVAPVLTLFIGGNHEASNYMQELPYGGWVAPNIYYLGYAGVVDFAGIRIAGLSGIYKGHDYLKGHFEISPYTDNSIRSVYHIRQLEVFRMKQLSGNFTIGLSHDWPRNAVNYGDVDRLLRFKPYFKEDIDDEKLGSPPAEEVLRALKPMFWFAGHLHCHYPALIPHDDSENHTKFLALDKCLPKRKFLQVIPIPHNEHLPSELSYDLEWLTVLHLTNHLLSVKPFDCYMPSSLGNERFQFTPTEAEKLKVLKMMNHNLIIPKNFTKTVESFDSSKDANNFKQPAPILNSQTMQLCDQLQIDDPVSLILLQSGSPLPVPLVAKDTSSQSTVSKEQESGDLSFICSPSPLSLPKPKFSSLNLQSSHEEISLTFDDEDDNLTEENLSIQNQSSNSMFVNASVNESSNSNSSMFVNTSINESSNSNSDSIISSTPVVGKKPFKRRNESLYSNSGDE